MRNEKWQLQCNKHKQDIGTHDKEVTKEASLDQKKWETILLQRQQDIFKDGSPDKRKPEEIVNDNYNQMKEKEQNLLNHTWEDYENA